MGFVVELILVCNFLFKRFCIPGCMNILAESSWTALFDQPSIYVVQVYLFEPPAIFNGIYFADISSEYRKCCADIGNSYNQVISF